MDPLTALRTAIMAGKESAIRIDGSDLVIDEHRYPTQSETAFKVQKGSRSYKLLPIWLQYLTKDKTFADYMKLASEYKVAMAELVLVTEKKVLIDYLAGASAALGHIDAALLSTGQASSDEAHGATIGGLQDVVTLEAAVGREVLHKTRASVLDIPSTVLGAAPIPGKTLKDKVYTILSSVAGNEADAAAASDGVTGKKRPRPTAAPTSSSSASGIGRQVKPIIIVPGATTALLNKYNAYSFLQDGKYITTDEARRLTPEKPSEILIRRKDARGNSMVYRVVDDVSGLKTYDDWARVVAVFAQGPEWQFKGWRWGRTPDRPDVGPAEIFNRCVGCYLMYEGDTAHENIPKWNVKPLFVSRTKRYLDPGVANQFWALVDTHVFTQKPKLLPAAEGAATAGAGSAK